ncbi:MAG: DUF3568 family protein [Candidatus Methanosuratincola sp.]|jgi:hypothetical protein
MDKRLYKGNYLLLAFLVLSSIGLGGCAAVVLGGAAAGAGAGTVAYIKGELQATEGVPIDRAWSAARGAVEEMKFVVTSEERDAVKGRINALGVDNRKIQISLNRKSESVTQVNIRVGVFGDEAVSRLILERMRARY